jgi:hypothetical protein
VHTVGKSSNPNGICIRAESNAYALDSTFLD